MGIRTTKTPTDTKVRNMDIFHTLQDFLLHTESIVYIIMGLSLLGFIGFWFFLTGRDQETWDD